MSTEEHTISVKELASQLKVSDALLKKIIKDFDIETERVQKRIHLPDPSVTTLREIMALRASGKKNKEIKELFDASKNAEETTEKDTKKAKAEKPAKKTDKKASDKTESKKTDNKKSDKKSSKTDSKKKRTKDNSAKEDKKEERSKSRAKAKEENAKEDEDGIIDLAGYMQETNDSEEDELSSLLNAEGDEEDLDEDLEEEEIEEVVTKDGKSAGSKKVRRRQFSYRYIQRQITNDSKRINYIKQKLRRGRISTKERLNLEDSLTQRSKLLAGWIHLLRWVKS